MRSELKVRLGKTLNIALRCLYFSKKLNDILAAGDCGGNYIKYYIRKIILEEHKHCSESVCQHPGQRQGFLSLQ